MILHQLGELNISAEDPKNIVQKIEDDIPSIIDCFDKIILSFIKEDKGYDISLFGEENYLKTLRNLNISNYPEETIYSIACLVIKNLDSQNRILS